jgi:hypothetical protein
MKKILLFFTLLGFTYFTGCDNNNTQSEVNYPAVDESAKTVNIPLLKESDLN